MKFRGFSRVIIIALILIYAIVLTRCAWIGDDAYITYRVVDNFIKGYGLVWNIDERVQVFTHPLWMFLISGIYFFSGNIYYTSIFLSIILSVIVVSIYAFTFPKSVYSAVFGMLALCFSKAYMDYSTSGLENPLSNLLLIIFFLIYFHRELTVKSYFFLSLIASFATLNRMDTLLLFLPALVYSFWRLHQFKKGIKALVTGFIPFFFWELFSLFYYGFPFPNTAYAKLNTGIPAINLIKQGMYYIENSLKGDPVTLFTIFFCLFIVILNKMWKYIPVLTGILLYILYTIKIGGCFMSGRYFTGPLLIAVILIADSGFKAFSKRWMISMVILLILGLTSSRSPIFSGITYGQNFGVFYPHNISDERGFYYPYTGLLRVISSKTPDPSFTATKTLNLDKFYTINQPKRLKPQKKNLSFFECVNVDPVNLQMVIGRIGFAAGQDVHIIDVVALADPLLSRLPVINKEEFWIGHFKRRVPDGYFETLKTGENCIKDANLARFYDKLSIIIKGKLFDSKRFIEILKMNLGLYDYLAVDNYTPPKLQHYVPPLIKLK